MDIKMPERISRPFIHACMGLRGEERPQDRELIDVSESLILKNAAPRWTYREFRWNLVEGLFPGEKLREHLEGARRVVLMGMTLGSEIDKLIRRYEIVDMAKALALDACASSLVEDMCDIFCQELGKEYWEEGLVLGGRFSPGYGDLPISSQGAFEELLQLQKNIGLAQSRENLLIPRKSVTAIMGLIEAEARETVGEEPQVTSPTEEEREMREHLDSCRICGLAGRCSFRAAGGYCGK